MVVDGIAWSPVQVQVAFGRPKSEESEKAGEWALSGRGWALVLNVMTCGMT